jgi:predicted ABC-class ATPase
MQESKDLQRLLRRIDNKGYGAYKDIRGRYRFEEYALSIDHVQGDPFAAPSRIHVEVPAGIAGFSPDAYATKSREVALRDFLTRACAAACDRVRTGRGSGKSGLITIDRPGQEILERTSVLVHEGAIEARLSVGLPANGRRIDAPQAEAMLFEGLGDIVQRSLLSTHLDTGALWHHIEVNEDADYLRSSLEEMGIVAFIANGAVLPRVSGVDDRPMKSGSLVPFKSPASLEVEAVLPHYGLMTGMGVPRGITLIVGGGYHGKSTLLNAVERGVYNHIPGDGREYVVTEPASVKIRAEDGRRVENVDISPFINNLPLGLDTRSFSTDDASGSTSQAANIMEALETGAKALFIDEDTSATNFMIRDHRMQELIRKEKEPITPFIDKVGQIFHEYGVSTLLVIGGSGDYFDVAGTVVCMEEYLPRDCTQAAHAVARKYSAERAPEGGDRFGTFRRRIPRGESFNPRKGKREVKIQSRGVDTIAYGTAVIDLSAIEQLVDESQTRAIGDAIHYATRYMNDTLTLQEVVDRVFSDILAGGLDIFSRRRMGTYAAFRPFELAAAINRLRTVRMKQKNGDQ